MTSPPSHRVELRFGVVVLPDAPFPTLFARWTLVEELGFDFLFAPDHARHTSNPSAPWFDGLTVAAAMALQTNTIRIGTLVANPVLHLPSALAKAAAAVDHLSGGRLELGIGMGVEEFDHHEAGREYWSARERAARYSEYVEVVDGVLQSSTRPFSFEGRYHRTTNATLAPSSLQQARPPLIIGSRSATGRALAVERGDCWNTYALAADGSVDAIAEKALPRNNELDERCADIDRDPRSLSPLPGDVATARSVGRHGRVQANRRDLSAYRHQRVCRDVARGRSPGAHRARRRSHDGAASRLARRYAPRGVDAEGGAIDAKRSCCPALSQAPGLDETRQPWRRTSRVLLSPASGRAPTSGAVACSVLTRLGTTPRLRMRCREYR